jgi:hypothetical protein
MTALGLGLKQRFFRRRQLGTVIAAREEVSIDVGRRSLLRPRLPCAVSLASNPRHDKAAERLIHKKHAG